MSITRIDREVFLNSSPCIPLTKDIYIHITHHTGILTVGTAPGPGPTPGTAYITTQDAVVPVTIGGTGPSPTVRNLQVTGR